MVSSAGQRSITRTFVWAHAEADKEILDPGGGQGTGSVRVLTPPLLLTASTEDHSDPGTVPMESDSSAPSSDPRLQI